LGNGQSGVRGVVLREVISDLCPCPTSTKKRYRGDANTEYGREQEREQSEPQAPASPVMRCRRQLRGRGFIPGWRRRLGRGR
jgi:hypothetical protein